MNHLIIATKKCLVLLRHNLDFDCFKLLNKNDNYAKLSITSSMSPQQLASLIST